MQQRSRNINWEKQVAAIFPPDNSDWTRAAAEDIGRKWSKICFGFNGDKTCSWVIRERGKGD